MLYRTFPCSECVIIEPWRTLWKISILTNNYFSFSCKHVFLMIPLIFNPSWIKIKMNVKTCMSFFFFFFLLNFSSATLLSKLCMGNKKSSERHWWRVGLFFFFHDFHVLCFNAPARLSSKTWVEGLGFWRCFIHCHFYLVVHVNCLSWVSFKCAVFVWR